MLKEHLETLLEGESFDCFYEPFALVTGVQSNLPVELAEYAFRRERDVQDYPELPADVSYQIKYVPEYMEESSSPAFYMIPPYDIHNENTIYINQVYTDESSLFSTLAHEGYPGHLYQIIYASEALSDPIRYLLFYSGYAEGWATYAEAESYAWNEYLTSGTEGAAELYRINAFLNLAIEALADLKIHYEGCSLEELKEYLVSCFGEIDEAAVESLYRIIISEPAYYMTYYGGYVEFLLLREKAEEELGEAFDLKEFHEFLLDMGPCSFPTIESYMDGWIAERK